MDAAPKLIALDMDGTLLDDVGRVSTRTRRALERAADAGHRIVLATGRPPVMAMAGAPDLHGTVSHVVGANGAMISTFPSSPDDEPEILHQIGFTVDDAHGVVVALRRRDPGFAFALATDLGFAHERGFAELMPAALPGDPVDDVLALGGSTAFRLFAFHHDWNVDELLDRVPALLAESGADDAGVQHMGADAVEIGPDAADKRVGLEWLCGQFGIAQRDVIAVGDELNDLTMIEWAGLGVAVANAAPQVLAIADLTIGSNHADGVARFLERFLD